MIEPAIPWPPFFFSGGYLQGGDLLEEFFGRTVILSPADSIFHDLPALQFVFFGIACRNASPQGFGGSFKIFFSMRVGFPALKRPGLNDGAVCYRFGVFAGRLLKVLFESEALSQDGLDVLLGGREGNLVDELGGVG